MDWPTFLIAGLVAVVFATIVFFEIRKKKSGKGCCSCGGGCGSCPVGCHK